MSAASGAMRHVVITGGTGVVGRHLVPHQLRQGVARVTVLDRVPFADPPPGVGSVAADLTDGIAWTPGEPVDLAFHLAAACREPGFTTAEYTRDNVLGTVRFAEWAARADVRNVVYTSTMMVYGARDERVTEFGETRPDTDYGRTKLEAERILEAWHAREPGRRLRIVRAAVIFGPGERNNFSRMHAALKRRAFAFVGRDSTVKSCLYVKDFVRVLALLALDGGAHRLYNAAYVDATTIRDVCDAMCRVYGWRRAVPTIPYGLARSAALPFEWLEAAGVVRTGIHRRRVEKLYRSTHIAADRLAALPFRPEFDLTAAIQDWRKDCGGGPLQ